MHIVQALGSSRRGGAEQFFTRLVIALHRRGVSQSSLVRPNAWAAERLAQNGVPSQTAWFGGRLDFVTRMRFNALLKKPPADIVITWMRRAAAACPSGPWIHIGRLGNYYKLNAFSGCDHLIGITPDIVSYIKRQGWPEDRVSLVPNFVPEVKAEVLPRSTFATPDNAPLLLWLGRMEHEKGPDVVVRSLAEIPGAYLWMAGAGSYEDEIKKLAHQLGVENRIRFLGWQDDIHALLETADIFLCASRNEAHGNIILEAWAHGVPIVATRSPGPAYLIKDAETGLLVQKEDATAMALRVNDLIANRDFARGMGLAGQNYFRATYSEDAVVQHYIDLFARLIAQRDEQRQFASQKKR